MEKIMNENGTIRLVPTNADNWLYNGSSFGKVVDCPLQKEICWSEVAESFKEETERKEQEENLPN